MSTTNPPTSIATGSLGFDHVSLRVPDYDASLAWYRTVLNLPLLREWTDPGLPGLRLAHLGLGPVKLEIIGDGDPDARTAVATLAEHMRPQGVIHLCLTVHDLGAAASGLLTHGIVPIAGPLYVDELDITLFVIQDNSGNVLEISQAGHHVPATVTTGLQVEPVGS